ncbi:hypothetical protein WJX82_009161 [Trebouxia sp. C0006]
MEKVLECPVCLNTFQATQECRRPRSLPCGHSVCSGCLDTILRSWCRRNCPACRHPLTAYHVARYPRNFALEQVASHFEQEKQDKSATRSAAADVEARENTCGVTQDTEYCKTCMETEEVGPSKAVRFSVGDILRAGVVTAVVITAAYKLLQTTQTRANPQRL